LNRSQNSALERNSTDRLEQADGFSSLLRGVGFHELDCTSGPAFPRLYDSLFLQEREMPEDAVKRARACKICNFLHGWFCTGLGQFSDCENYFFWPGGRFISMFFLPYFQTE
jgi:hypothetical protein